MKQADSAAASSALSGGQSRVLLSPLTGALHMIASAMLPLTLASSAFAALA
jgi:hypothetical protein